MIKKTALVTTLITVASTAFSGTAKADNGTDLNQVKTPTPKECVPLGDIIDIKPDLSVVFTSCHRGYALQGKGEQKILSTIDVRKEQSLSRQDFMNTSMLAYLSIAKENQRIESNPANKKIFANLASAQSIINNPDIPDAKKVNSIQYINSVTNWLKEVYVHPMNPRRNNNSVSLMVIDMAERYNDYLREQNGFVPNSTSDSKPVTSTRTETAQIFRGAEHRYPTSP